MPNEKFEGRLTRTSYAIDQNTRTLLVEVQVRNRSGRLSPGMYVVVNFVEVKPLPPVMVPGEAIVVRNARTTVAVVENNVVRFRPASLGRDYGTETEVVSGLKAGEVIVTTITDEIRDGAKINPQYSKAEAGPESTPGQAEEGQYGNQRLGNQAQKSGNKSGSKGGSNKAQ